MLYSRPGCGLCEEMLSELASLTCAQGVPIDIVNVDLDLAARARYGHKIPVLMFAGELLCHGRLDPEEVDKTLSFHRRPV
ncbi:MAG: glutaredoxin family protein [Steroidobacteraceae bacterium]